MHNKTLRQLYEEHQGKVSDKWSLYLDEYQRIFSEFENDPVRMLEIGVQNGGSLEIWANYFAKGEAFVGCDVNPECDRLVYDDPRISLVVGDANTNDTEKRISEIAQSFDIIVDDGSHQSGEIINSFARYFPKLSNGGIFVVEDLHCSYWQEFEGGLYHPFSSIAFFKRLVDILNYQHWGIDSERHIVLSRFIERYGVQVEEKTLASIHSVEFANSLCILRKRGPDYNTLKKRIIVGTEENVCQVHSLANEGVAVHAHQRTNPWTNEDALALEALPALRSLIALHKKAFEKYCAELSVLKSELAKQREAVAERDESILILTNTVSTLETQLEIKNSTALQALDAERRAHADTKALLRVADAKQEAAKAESIETVSKLSSHSYQLEARIQALEASLSWKLTEPIRALADRLHKLKNSVQIARRALALGGGLRGSAVLFAKVVRSEGFEGVGARLKNASALMQMEKATARPATVSLSSSSERYDEWRARHDPSSDEERADVQRYLSSEVKPPLISIIIAIRNPNATWLLEAIQSVQNQNYRNWELCIGAAAPIDATTRTLLETIADSDARIKIASTDENITTTLAANNAILLTKGSWLALMDQHDAWDKNALLVFADAIIRNPALKIIYSDEDNLDENGDRCLPFFKPDWSPHLACSQPYLGRSVCVNVSTDIVPFKDASVDITPYSLWMPIAASASRAEIKHIAKVLYHSRKNLVPYIAIGETTSLVIRDEVRLVQRFVELRYPNHHITVRPGPYRSTYRLDFENLSDRLYSIIIPTKDKANLLSACVQSILEFSTIQNFEIIIINNNSSERDTFEYFDRIRLDSRIKVIDYPFEFNWSKINNYASALALGKVLVFLNNDTEVLSEQWLDFLGGYAVLPDVGIVGALLLFEDGTIQHSGVVLGLGGWADHLYKMQPAMHSTIGPFVSPLITRNVLAVTGACMAIERQKFDKLGGFDENFIICGSDVELCLRSHKSGFYNVICTEAQLTHFESKTRSAYIPREDFEQSILKYAPYRTEEVDPFFNPNLSLQTTQPEIKV